MNPLTGYNYCKSFTIVHSPDGSQSNYQMKLTIIRGAGTSSTGTLYLDNKSINWPLDIRFTQSDGVTLLPFYRREYDATDGTWWLLIDSIPDPANFTGYVHVGNAAATDASNISTTFGVGMADDFEWGSDEDEIDTSGGNITWAKIAVPNAYARIDTAQCWQGTRSLRLTCVAGKPADAYFTKAVGTDYAINFMVRHDNDSQAVFLHGNGTHIIYAYISPALDLEWYDGANTDTGFNATVSVWEEQEINDINLATPKWDWWWTGTKIANDALCLHGATQNGVIDFENADPGTYHVDSVLVRKWTANEPAFGVWGTWERISPYTGPIIITRPKYKIEVRDANGVLKWVL